jgi:hypothetical protein
MHVLNVMECAKALVAAIAQSGGLAKADVTQEGVRDALRALFDQTSKLQVYEARAAARGTMIKLDDERLSMAIKEVRDRRVTTVTEEDRLAETPEQAAEKFSLDAPEDDTPATTDDVAPESGERNPSDLFTL